MKLKDAIRIAKFLNEHLEGSEKQFQKAIDDLNLAFPEFKWGFGHPELGYTILVSER